MGLATHYEKCSFHIVQPNWCNHTTHPHDWYGIPNNPYQIDNFILTQDKRNTNLFSVTLHLFLQVSSTAEGLIFCRRSKPTVVIRSLLIASLNNSALMFPNYSLQFPSLLATIISRISHTSLVAWIARRYIIDL